VGRRQHTGGSANVLAVLVALLYWLWRLRIKRSFRGIVGIATSENA
jgi:hypothetical protein